MCVIHCFASCRMKRNRRKVGFTLVELLTVLAVVTLLVSMMIPSMITVRRVARNTKQQAQLNAIDMALITFRNDYGQYPPSYFIDPATSTPTDYCGAQKLCEALLGWDLMGFHPNSAWRADGHDQANGPLSYDPDRVRLDPVTGQPITFQERRGRYLELSTASPFKVIQLFPEGTGSLAPETYVLCDAFGAAKVPLALPDGTTRIVKAGAPILYYRARTEFKTIPPSAPAPDQATYYVMDNAPVVTLQQADKWLGDSTGYYENFYTFIKDWKVQPVPPAPPVAVAYRPDSYILITAGADGQYGTADDICNFGE